MAWWPWSSRRREASPRSDLRIDRLASITEDGGYLSLPSSYALTSAVWACVSRISSRIASAQWEVIEERGGVARPVRDHPALLLLRSPSPLMDAGAWWRTLAEDVLLEGNAYAHCAARMDERMTGVGMPGQLRYALPGSASIWTTRMGPSGSGRMVYYEIDLPLPSGHTDHVRAPARDVLHVRGPHYLPASGRSRSPLATAAKESQQLLALAQAAARSYLDNSARYTGVMESQLSPTDASTEELSTYFALMREKMAGVSKRGYAPLLPFGVTWKYAPAPGSDQQVSADLNFAISDIARVYGVPLAMLQHTHGQRPDIEQLEDALRRDAVMPLADAIGRAATRSILSFRDRTERGLSLRMRLPQLSATMSGAAAIISGLAQSGVLTINELRALLGEPPIDGGDVPPNAAGTPANPEAPDGGGGEGMPPEDESGDPATMPAW